MTSSQIPKLRPPAQSRGVSRDASPARPGAGPGVLAAAVDCSKLTGLARSMCYQAQSLPLSSLMPFTPANPTKQWF